MVGDVGYGPLSQKPFPPLSRPLPLQGLIDDDPGQPGRERRRTGKTVHGGEGLEIGAAPAMPNTAASAAARVIVLYMKAPFAF
jgi:hypothetical protein